MTRLLVVFDWCERRVETGVHNLFNMKDTLNVTGGGAFKFEKLLKERLNVSINKLDEMKMLVNGLNFVLSHVHNEVFTYSHETKKQTFVPPKSGEDSDMYPYLLVNIGSGVSILKVTSKDQFQRVSGSSIGGGTFWGLACQMAGVRTWDEVHEMSLSGDNRNIDLLVGDIYGTGYDKLGLDANVIASSFGKAGIARTGEEDDTGEMVAHDETCVQNQLNATSSTSSPSKDDREDENGGFAVQGTSAASQRRTSVSEQNKTDHNVSPPSPTTSNVKHSSSPIDVSPSSNKNIRKEYYVAAASPSGVRSPFFSTKSAPENAPTASEESNPNHFKNADIVKSLLFMICNNIGQVAFLNANLHQVKRVYFAGGFLQRNPYIWSTLSFAIKFWSKGDMEAMFLVHDGYLGALGALVADPPTDVPADS